MYFTFKIIYCDICIKHINTALLLYEWKRKMYNCLRMKKSWKPGIFQINTNTLPRKQTTVWKVWYKMCDYIMYSEYKVNKKLHTVRNCIHPLYVRVFRLLVVLVGYTDITRLIPRFWSAFILGLPSSFFIYILEMLFFDKLYTLKNTFTKH